MMKAIFVSTGAPEIIERVYDAEVRKELAGRADFIPPLAEAKDLEPRKNELSEVEFIFSTWGMLPLDEGQIAAYFPSLRAVFYAAGTVQEFARPFLAGGVRIFSAADANAVPVIEYTLAQIVLANKGFFGSSRLYTGGDHGGARKYASAFPGNFDTPVGLIGAGKIGRGLIGRLKEYRLDVSVFDPFLDAAGAEALGVKKAAALEELFSSSFVISNHLPDKEETRGLLHYGLFSLMHDYGVFINTGRGRQVVEEDLVRALREKPGRTALLDVTWPEPVSRDHPFYGLDNVILSPHIAGSGGRELARMGSYMAAEFGRFLDGLPLKFEVSAAMLSLMA